MFTVQEVARAIEPETFELPSINLYRQDYDRAYARARRAIAAMRDMVPVVRDQNGQMVHEIRGAPRDVWRAMIDAALQE